MTAVLERWRDAEWLLVDCLGLPLLPAVERELPALFPGPRLAAFELALVSPETTTDGFYRQIVEAGVRHSFAKVTAIDNLLHERFLPFGDLQRLAMAELHAACGPIRKRLDGLPLAVFADHGFRLAPDGASYRHGGDSTLERVVPLFRLEA